MPTGSFFSYTLENNLSSPFVLLKNIIKDKDIVSKKRELPTFYGWKPLPIFEFITLLDNLIDYVSIHPSSQILEYDL